VSVTLAFVALGYGTNFGGIVGSLFLLSCSRLLLLMSSLCDGVWVLDLLGWEDGEGLDTEIL